MVIIMEHMAFKNASDATNVSSILSAVKGGLMGIWFIGDNIRTPTSPSSEFVTFGQNSSNSDRSTDSKRLQPTTC